MFYAQSAAAAAACPRHRQPPLFVDGARGNHEPYRCYSTVADNHADEHGASACAAPPVAEERRAARNASRRHAKRRHGFSLAEKVSSVEPMPAALSCIGWGCCVNHRSFVNIQYTSRVVQQTAYHANNHQRSREYVAVRQCQHVQPSRCGWLHTSTIEGRGKPHRDSAHTQRERTIRPPTPRRMPKIRNMTICRRQRTLIGDERGTATGERLSEGRKSPSAPAPRAARHASYSRAMSYAVRL